MLATGAFLLPGCAYHEPVTLPGPRPHYANPAKNLRGIARIVVVEPANLSAHPKVSIEFTNGLSRALERKNLFGQITVYRQDADFARYQLDCDRCPPRVLREVRKAYGCDAILTGTIRDYQTYPRLAMSVSLRLVDLADGELIWAMEQVWDSTDKAIEERMRGFFATEMREGYDPLNWKLGLISPNVFNKFVCYEIAETLGSSD